MSDDTVRLTVPARPEYVRLARLTAAGLASSLGFGYDEVEDLRIAVDELCYVLVGWDGRAGEMQLEFVVSRDKLTVLGHGAGGVGSDLSDLSHQILRAIVDDYEVTATDHAVSFRMVCSRHGR